MKKIVITSLLCATALFINACSSEDEKLSQDAFEFNIKDESQKYYPNSDKKAYELLLTAKDNVEITKITANSGGCFVRELGWDYEKVEHETISEKTPPKRCYSYILNDDWLGADWFPKCLKLVKWIELSKEDCNYKFAFDTDYIDDKTKRWKNLRVEKTQDSKYIESCEKAKKIAKEMNDGKYYYDYKIPMKFGKTKEFVIEGDKCSDVVEFSVYTNKGVVTYNVKQN